MASSEVYFKRFKNVVKSFLKTYWKRIVHNTSSNFWCVLNRFNWNNLFYQKCIIYMFSKRSTSETYSKCITVPQYVFFSRNVSFLMSEYRLVMEHFNLKLFSWIISKTMWIHQYNNKFITFFKCKHFCCF